MDSTQIRRRGETDAHLRLKRLAFLWAQGNGYSACAAEVTLPRCRYRADVAAYRPRPKQPGVTAIFECKQARADLFRDNCTSALEQERLRSISRRRDTLERLLRIHYPTLRTGDSLFPEYDVHDFSRLKHRTYERVTRQFVALQARLCNAVKFERLVRYRCANLFILVLSSELSAEAAAPPGWGVLLETNGSLSLVRKPLWHDSLDGEPLQFLQRIAIAGTRQFNRAFQICFDEIQSTRQNGGEWG